MIYNEQISTRCGSCVLQSLGYDREIDTGTDIRLEAQAGQKLIFDGEYRGQMFERAYRAADRHGL